MSQRQFYLYRRMDPEKFLQERKERAAKTRRRIATVCALICLLWIPIALFFVYQPSFLFSDAEKIS